MYSKLGFLKNNVFQKVTRSDLIAGYLGQTAIKTQKVIEKSLGGVLFIDEAYALGEYSQNDSFSKECIDTICEALSNYKDDLMVIVAGYEEELNETFFKMNRGLDSRFIWRFKIEPYSPKEMKEIFMKKVFDNEWAFEALDEINEKWFEKKKDSFRYFGRDMEVLFTYIKIVHGRRIYGKSAEYRKKISLCDLEKGYQLFVKNKNVKPENMVFKNMYI
jgi:SpoVK/Ycf46/Vps4 family AAA+-type ATPase